MEAGGPLRMNSLGRSRNEVRLWKLYIHGPAFAGEGQPGLIFARRKGSLLTITPQFSSGLNTWEAGSGACAVAAEDDLIEACRVKFPEVLSDGKVPRFARLAISTP